MLEKLFQFVFQLITKVADLLVSPFVSALTSLFPDLSTAFLWIGRFFDVALTYFSFIWKFLMIPQFAISALFTYYGVKYSIYLLKISINFVLKIYNLLKP